MQKTQDTSTPRRLYIGDVHGHVDKYYKILQKNKFMPSLQVGDFGFKKHHEWHLDNLNSSQHKVLFGNHDDYTYVYEPHSMGDASFLGGVLTIRGADSIDKHMRTEGVSWWREEELSYQILQDLIIKVPKMKPRIIVTHDCPQFIRAMEFGIHESSRTSQALQAIFEAYKPDIWVFGHHHKRIDKEMHGTRFICLEELGTIIL